jgi:hypothetical protein
MEWSVREVHDAIVHNGKAERKMIKNGGVHWCQKLV